MKKATKKTILVLLMMVSLVLSGCKTDNTSDTDSTEILSKDTESGKVNEEVTTIFKVGYVNSADTDIFDKMKKDIFEQVVSEDTSIEVTFADANMDMQRQLDAIDNFITLEVDLMIVVPVDFAGVIPGIEKANEADIPVICLGIAAGGGDFIFIGSENYDAGYMQGEFMVENLAEDAKVLYLSGSPGYAHSTDRRQGFLDAIASRTDIEVIAEQTGMYERAKGMQIMEDWTQTFDEVNAVVAANDQMALGAIQALIGANRIEGVLVSGVDGTEDACVAIKKGEMAQSIFQSAPGLAKACYETIQKYQNEEEVEAKIMVPFESITIDNVEDYIE